MITLGEVVHVKKGRKPSLIREVPLTGDVRLLQIDDLRAESKPKYMPADRGAVFAMPSDIIVAWDGANAGTSSFGLDGAIGSTLARLRPKDPTTIWTPFVGHFVASKRTHLRQTAKGATIPHLDPTVLSGLRLSLPALSEQKRIAAILERARGIGNKRRQALVMLDELEQATFLSMFGHDRETLPVSSFCEVIVDCVNRTAPTVEAITPFKMLRTTNVRNGAVDTTNVRYVSQEVFEKWNRRLTPMSGDVLLTREAPVGEAGVLRGKDHVFLGQRLMLYRVDSALMTAEYLAACFRSPILQAQFDRLGSGSTVKHLPLPACRNFEIPVAPLSDQTRFSESVAAIDELRHAYLRALRAEDEIFASLQARAFRGEL